MAIDFPSIPLIKDHLPKLRDLPGMDPAKKALSRSVDQLKSKVGGVLDHLQPDNIPLPRSLDFGSLGRMLEGSPLTDFLGGLPGFGPGPDAPNGKNISGSRIPGGRSLYDGRGMYHKGAPGAPDTYAFENSPQGIQFAAKRGYKSIDLDMQITKDGHMVATHWSQPMKKDGFRDPLGKLDKDTKVSDMTLAEVMRLRNQDGQSRIYPMSTMIKELKKNGIAGDLEAKSDPRFATDEVMGSLADLVRKSGIRANLKSINRGPQTKGLLEMGQRHGFWVRTASGNGHDAKNYGYGS